MTALWFLLGAVVISAIGSAIVVLRYRQPGDRDWSVEEFRREMQALSPDAQPLRRPTSGRPPKTVHPVRSVAGPAPPFAPPDAARPAHRTHRAGDRGR